MVFERCGGNGCAAVSWAVLVGIRLYHPCMPFYGMLSVLVHRLRDWIGLEGCWDGAVGSHLAKLRGVGVLREGATILVVILDL